jgi:hypothetical protein
LLLVQGLTQETDYLVSSLMATMLLVGMGCLNTTTCRGVGIRIERHSDELLFDLAYTHPWLHCCATDAVNYDNLDRRWRRGSRGSSSNSSSEHDEENPPATNAAVVAGDLVGQSTEAAHLLLATN